MKISIAIIQEQYSKYLITNTSQFYVFLLDLSLDLSFAVSHLPSATNKILFSIVTFILITDAFFFFPITRFSCIRYLFAETTSVVFLLEVYSILKELVVINLLRFCLSEIVILLSLVKCNFAEFTSMC